MALCLKDRSQVNLVLLKEDKVLPSYFLPIEEHLKSEGTAEHFRSALAKVHAPGPASASYCLRRQFSGHSIQQNRPADE